MDNNIQLYPNKKRIVPNCKIAKVINNLDDTSFNNLINGVNKGRIVEMKNHKKHGKVSSDYTITNNSDDQSDPLSEFDRAVLSVCISEWEAGNRHTTPAIILRGLTGKNTKNGNGNLHKDQRAAILHSVQKMMGLIINIDLSNVNQKLNYNGGQVQKITEAILPCKHVSTSINGQIVDDTIVFLDESPIMKVARDRKQILTFDAELLDIPNQNNTQMNITIKNYAMCRVQECILHKLQPTITFEDIFKKCRIDKADNKTKLRAREVLIKFFEHLKSKGVISSFELVKKSTAFYSIKFTF
ncbi:MAG: hypothetical protein IJ563_11365 [Selenomonadaceae bacterium]|nr:hypothetical protein [Selenomonadaceae bacterium]